MNGEEKELIDKFKSLPNDIVPLIISYLDNLIVYRNGKFIDRISKSDVRYSLLGKIPRPIYIYPNDTLLRLERNNVGYFLRFWNNPFTMNVRSFTREYDGFDSYFNIKSNIRYKFCGNEWICELIKL